MNHLRSMTRMVAAAALIALSGTAAAQSAPAKLEGGVLVGPNGMTLYVFDKDPAAGGKSVCNGGCAANWPPLAAAGDAMAAGDYVVITRDDGSKQWAFKGKPLYYWAKDQKPGDKTGDGFNSVWHVAVQ
ncbi:hypothetical protein [Accumulibacter sp.]|uniref:COG4315 family predicted lipoprotein n=1 Tax=Accumulibacter sp. TaxID=2053492 RepID=UPI0028C49852|nr:hypothetical protein [Accumulibacter sp.]